MSAREAIAHEPGERARTRAKIVGWLRGTLVFCGLLPWALPFMRARLPMGVVGDALDLVFFGMCHRRAARTLVLDGVAMPLCSRCAGIFLGVAIAAAIGRPILAMRSWRVLFVIACALMLTDVVTQDLGLHPVWHPTRITSGLLVGYLMVVGFLSGLARDAQTDPLAARPPAPDANTAS
jgi:uncharacterized membrane protein